MTLVGAGPGDAGLITARGLAAIRTADAIVYDRLIPAELLREARPDCARYDVGKTPGAHTLTQDEINALLVRLAAKHERIVRLKGGDSFVFGRGGEEMQYLRSRGIACEAIPGVTSAIAVPESVGIPVTLRGVATSFRVITAKGESFTADDLDYASMRDPKTTLVFLMGFSQLRRIVRGLLEAGRSPTTPSAVISEGTTSEARQVRGPLSEIAALAEAANLAAPAIILVGDVAAFGRRCLVAKVGEAPSKLGERLRAAGAIVTEITVGRITLRPRAVDGQVDGVDWLIVTSGHAVEALTDEVCASLRARSVRIAAIGPTTAAALAKRGLEATFIPSVANSPTLLRELTPRLKPTDVVLRLLPTDTDDSLAPLATACVYKKAAVYSNDRPASLALPPRTDYDDLYCTSRSCRERIGR